MSNLDLDDLLLVCQYAIEVCDLCEDDYPAQSERGLALSRLRAVAESVKPEERR